MSDRSKFRRGETTFVCNCCGHNTRNTGVQSVGSNLCPDCYELAGIDNACLDGVGEQYHEEAKAYIAAIAKKGGNMARLYEKMDSKELKELIAAEWRK